MNTVKLPELKGCPFCGGVAFAENYIIEAAVICFGCKARVVRRHGPKDNNGLPEAIAAWNARAAVEASQPKAEAVEGFSLASLFKSADGSLMHEVGGRMVQDVYESGVLVSRIPYPAQPSAAVTDAKDAELYRALSRIVLAVQGHGIDWKWGEGSLDAAIESAAMSQGGKP